MTMKSTRLQPDLIAKYDGRVPRYTSYPTAPHFDSTVGPETYARWLAALPAGEALSLYVHIPFCDTLCWFCGCHTTVVSKPAPVRSYLDVLLREIELIAARLGRRRRVAHLHLGGGSPTMLTPAQIKALFNALATSFDLRTDPEIAVEVDPRALSEAVVDAFADGELTRASIGVQDLDPAVQRAVNRIQPFEVTERAVSLLRNRGVRGLNLDLMYGLPHQTVEGTRATAARILTLRPDRIALFGYAHVPWMKKHQKLIPDAALPDAAARWQQYEAAAACFTAAGYVPVGLDHFARPEDPMAAALRDGELRRNFQGYTTDRAPALIGLGASAIGRLPQGYVQNHPSVRDYAAAVKADQPATARGVALTPDDELRANVIERLMCDMTVDLRGIAEAHGVDLACFHGALERLVEMQADGLVRVDGCRVSVPEHARPLLRAVAAVFDTYLATGPESRHARAV